MDLDLKRVWLTQLIGRFYQNIYFSSYSPLQVQNLPRQPLPESSWVRVRNRLAGIGGNDLHLLYGDSDIRIAPAAAPNHKHLYPGHEVVGEVIEIGADVQNIQVGDRVVLQSGPNCITAGILPLCRACAHGSYNLCEHGAFIAPQPLGGGWSEEMLLHEQQLFRVPAALSDEQAVMLEPTAIALHAVLRHLPQPGDRVLVIGAGTVGLITLQILRALVPGIEISVMARYPFQVEQATRLGATNIIYAQDSYSGVQQATKAKLYQGMLGNQILMGGYDTIYDTVGHKKTLHHALRWTRSQGTVVLIGLNLRYMNLDLSPLWYQEVNLLGSTSHGVEHWPQPNGSNHGQQTSTFDVATELIQQQRITPEQLITHHFALNNFKHALLTAKHKPESRAIKVVFDYSLLPASVVPTVRASAPRRHFSTVNIADYIHSLEKEGLESQSQEQEQEQEQPQTRTPEPQVQESQPQPEVEPVQHTSVASPSVQETKIQDTPPVIPLSEEWALNAQQIADVLADASEDTAVAIPALTGLSTSQQNEGTIPQDNSSSTKTEEEDDTQDKTQRFDRAQVQEAISQYQKLLEHEEPAHTPASDATLLFQRADSSLLPDAIIDTPLPPSIEKEPMEETENVPATANREATSATADTTTPDEEAPLTAVANEAVTSTEETETVNKPDVETSEERKEQSTGSTLNTTNGTSEETQKEMGNGSTSTGPTEKTIVTHIHQPHSRNKKKPNRR